MTTLAIAESKIKLAWREKYLTDGANERGLSSPRGAYRGYWLSPRLAPDTWLRLIIDPYTPGHDVDKDQFAVLADRTTGFSLSVRETTDIEFNCVDLFPVVGATEDWYVYIEADYTPNVATTANYRVEKTDPHLIASPNYDPNALILGVIPMTLGDLAINFVVMPPLAGMYDRRCIPSPTARQLVADFGAGDEPWGLFDGISKWNLGTGSTSRYFAEPTVEIVVCAAPTTKFQLSGRYYVGKDVAGTAKKHFRFMSQTLSGNSPLISAVCGGWIPVKNVYLSDGVTLLVPSADADDNGFYLNPWLDFDFAYTTGDVSFTGTLQLKSFKRKKFSTLENEPAMAFPVGDAEVAGHSGNIRSKSHVGTPSSLAEGLLDWQMADMLGFVNDRIKTIHPTAVPVEWTLLWRSHAATLDAAVTKQVSSIYFGPKGFLLLVGGYIQLTAGPTQWAVIAGTGTGNVQTVYLGTGVAADPASGYIRIKTKLDPVAGSNWDVETGWDLGLKMGSTGSTDFVQSEGAPFVPTAKLRIEPALHVDEFLEVLTGIGFPHLAYKTEETVLATAGYPRFRKFVSQEAVYFTSNCSYNAWIDEWAYDVGGQDAVSTKISKDGVEVRRQAGGGPAAWTETTWDSTLRVGVGIAADAWALFEADGNLIDRVRCCFNILNFVGAAAPVALPCRTAVTFHMKWDHAPIAVTVQAPTHKSVVSGGSGDWASWQAEAWDTYGAMLSAATIGTHLWNLGDHLWSFHTVFIES